MSERRKTRVGDIHTRHRKSTRMKEDEKANKKGENEKAKWERIRRQKGGG
jgi:hypothetical protein